MTRWRRAADGAVGLLVAALVAGGGGCNRPRAETEAEGDVRSPVVEVRLDSVRTGSIPEILVATGSTRALRQESVSSPVEGQITSLRVVEGDAVKSGDVLAAVMTKESLAARTGAEMLLAQARDDAERQSARAALARAERSQAVLDIRAPFDGVVATRERREGEFVDAGGPVVTVLDLGSLCFAAKLPARDLARVRAGQAATVRFQAWPERAYACRVETVQPQVDPLGQVAELRLGFLGSPAGLRSDLFGTAEIVVGEHAGVLLVPRRAVLRDDETGRHTVVESVGDTLAVVRPVALGIETPDLAEISGPAIRAGTRVLVEGHYALPDSSRIRPADQP